MTHAPQVRVGKPHRPLGVKVINSVGRAVSAFGMKPISLDAEQLIAKAIKKVGVSDFGGEDFKEGLERFLTSAEEEAELTVLGRIIAQSTVSSALANRLQLVDWRKKHPEIDEEEIIAPVFIVGLPRTGTTILHGLLGQDPANRALTSWEAAEPVPPATPSTWDKDPRIQSCQKALDQMLQLVPGFDAIHPMGATMPQECVAVFTMCFRSDQLNMQFALPSYESWLRKTDMRSTYEFHKSVLQHVQSGGVRGDRWVLKSPMHVYLIETLLSVFPDARIVHTHRDPIQVAASAASLTTALRGASSDAIDPHRIGREQVTLWAKLVNESVEQRKRLAHKSDQFFDIHMSEIVADPINAVRRMYARFDHPLTDEVASKMAEFIAQNPRDKQGSHAYSAKDFGIDPARDRGLFQDYITYFGLDEPETG
ncbi:MAG: sulfotransferase [Myxococcota bacterium]